MTTRDKAAYHPLEMRLGILSPANIHAIHFNSPRYVQCYSELFSSLYLSHRSNLSDNRDRKWEMIAPNCAKFENWIRNTRYTMCWLKPEMRMYHSTGLALARKITTPWHRVVHRNACRSCVCKFVHVAIPRVHVNS